MSMFSDLPAGVWRADGLADPSERVLPTGMPALDAALPGGGWPWGALVEVLQSRPQASVWSLLAPGLAQALAAGPGALVLVAPPQTPFVPSLAAQGLSPSRWLRIEADRPAARLWATEQALRCAEVAAVLAWLPQATAGDLRRLQLAAQRHQQLLFVMRPASVAAQASPARLRLLLSAPAVGSDPDPVALQVQILKRRGAPRVAPVGVPLQPLLLRRLLDARGMPRAVGPAPRGAVFRLPAHGLDRTAAPA